ncbi:MAG: A/G-specific adenine glycosylase [Actinomycetota bacterium]|nr:A/G-specific adenine glycosylase [Actinomycetota bacterium]MEE3252369.1 A/G-specific adenine glycosylase [Actinomycetota bacterium]
MSSPSSPDLLEWGRPRLRDLPWRQTRDPWPVLVAEVMLQQTRVDRVVPRWGRFLDRFPDPAACAEAPVGDVLREWSGLGYNRRAVNLHRCATQVVAMHGGDLPADLDALLALPGIGSYTARAVLAFAFEEDVAVVDTNVARVLARRAGRRLTMGGAQALADASVPDEEGWAWNQVMLDLGALVCRARRPRCGECPVSGGCAWQGSGPDPATGSAGVSGTQSRFEGSDRQGRGRLVAALGRGPVAARHLAPVMGWPDDPGRSEQVAAGVVADGLAIRSGSTYRLP